LTTGGMVGAGIFGAIACATCSKALDLLLHVLGCHEIGSLELFDFGSRLGLHVEPIMQMLVPRVDVGAELRLNLHPERLERGIDLVMNCSASSANRSSIASAAAGGLAACGSARQG